MLPIVAVTIVILFVAAALSIDIAHVHLVRSELRTATDAAARAAIESLGREQDLELATQAAIRVASINQVAGQGLTLSRNNIQFGGATQNEDGSFSFDPDSRFINSVRVVGERVDGSADGPVPCFLVLSSDPPHSNRLSRPPPPVWTETSAWFSMFQVRWVD